MDFFNEMVPLLRTFWYVAIPTSLVFIFQTIGSFVGADSTDGVDADFDGDLEGGAAPSQVFSLRNMINFLLGFSWTGISFFHTISSTSWLIILSVGVGIAFVSLFFVIIRQLQKLAEDNSFSYHQTVGQKAEVYLSIPEKRSGKGKVSISIKGSHHELEAVTSGDRIPTGSLVQVIAIENETLLLVEKI